MSASTHVVAPVLPPSTPCSSVVLPKVQSVHSVCLPALAVYVSLPHSWHVGEPPWGAYLPASQSLQRALELPPNWSRDVPLGQLKQANEPAKSSLYVPFPQLSHTVLFSTECFPSGHTRQDSSFGASGAWRYLPGLHSIETAAPLPAYLPGGAMTQLVWSLFSWYRPAAQGVESAAPVMST